MEEIEMKKFAVAELVELDVNKTAFGIECPENPDSEKTSVYGDNGELLGYEQLFGESNN